MKDLDDAVRTSAQRFEPPPDWLERIEARVDRRGRNRRVLATTVGVGMPLAVVVAITLLIGGEPSDPPRPGGSADVRTHLTIDRSPSGPTEPGDRVVISGRILAADPACQAGRIVSVLELAPQGDELVRTVTSDAEGNYRIVKFPKHGRTMYVRVAWEVREGTVCDAARSAFVVVDVDLT